MGNRLMDNVCHIIDIVMQFFSLNTKLRETRIFVITTFNGSCLNRQVTQNIMQYKIH